MEPTDLLPLLEQLDDNVDDLEDVLQPVLGHQMSKLSKNLPVMDKAKLHVLITYALESLIFSYLRLHGVDAKQHPVFRELTRVKQYFEKMKALETEPEQRTMTLDKAAANRFIKHGLAGNDKLDLERAEKEAKEKARAQFKAAMLQAKNKPAAKPDVSAVQSDAPSSAAHSTVQSSADSNDSDQDLEDEDSAQQSSEPAQSKAITKKKMAEKLQARSKNADFVKKQRKLSKEDRTTQKKDRRHKKEALRKARKSQ
ncbi:hypothetical protein N7462_001605 [Penicillium macrosclerotiorum]|uniref:uncharacterized protein n=1 Tax=Penicillium macrosclerotiorum TaxID=303699 RepID=UPI002548BF40|nr:uncharacterized protein N7462_001605 [Penicillium macrosclerotiorum]KAJ5692182.1 hypothetical protein N7462_001605 [Penicillium macrosclerotiorum]